MALKALDNPRWYRLDNAAKIYPAVKKSDWGSVYRMACYLDEAVDPERLQRALDAALPRFPMYAVSLRRGFFWYYHENLRGTPKVEEESSFPCVMPDALDNENFLFRVLYYKNRVSVEFFHSLTDGTGALTFLKTLVAEYLCLGGLSVPAANGVLDRRQRPESEESEDAFQRYAGSAKGGSFKESQAYALPYEALPLPYLRVTHGVVDASALSKAAKDRGATITALLVAIFQLSLDAVQRQDEGVPQRPVKVSIPVNMRKLHASKTLRNFSLFTNAPLPMEDFPPTLDEAVAAVTEAMRKGLAPEVLDLMMSKNVSAERSPALKPAPLFLKRIALRIANSVVGENQFTSALSNLGVVELPEGMSERVTRFDFMLGRSRKANVNCGVVGYKGKIVISLSSSAGDRSIEEDFFRRLSELGLKVAVQTNVEGGIENASAASYPTPPAISTRARRLKITDRVAAHAAVIGSAFLVFLDIVTPISHTWWPYPVGAILCAWALWRAPRGIPRPKAPYMVFLTEVLSLGYVGLIAIMAGSSAEWYWGYFFPAAIAASSSALAILIAAQKRAFKKIYVPLAVNLFLGVLCLPLAVLAGAPSPNVFPGIVFFFSLTGLILVAYRGRKWWINELKRKMHI